MIHDLTPPRTDSSIASKALRRVREPRAKSTPE
jgi:hypothetical protein